MSAIVRSVASYLAGGRSRSSGFDRASASIGVLRLDAEIENTVRYVFCDWEAAAGVRSNHGAQVERVAAGIFREALHTETRAAQRVNEARKQTLDDAVDEAVERAGGVRLALSEGNFRVRDRIPLSERGWSRVTAKPSGASTGGFPMRTITIGGKAFHDDDGTPTRCTVAATEQWAMLPRSLPGHRGPVRRTRVVEVWRALRALETRSTAGPRLLVALHMAYGPRDPAADYHTFGELAPLVHLTDVAWELAAKATKAERRARAEAAVEPGIEDEARAAVIASWVANDRVTVYARTAVAAHLDRLKGADRRIAVSELTADARKLLTRASNALMRELRDAAPRAGAQ